MAESSMNFVPMTSISKNMDNKARKCSEWVATEKVHGSSFQMYTKDGSNVNLGSRRRNVDELDSFIKCDIKQLLREYRDYAIKTWHLIHSRDRWEAYREPSSEYQDEEDDGDIEDADDGGAVAETETETRINTKVNGNIKESENVDQSDDICIVRIYGELYGGGGLEKSEKGAAQKEIIYSDDFRFYVFGITINKKWVTIRELNDLCQEAGFPYYAKPVCEPKETVEDLKQWLADSGFMRTRSALTDKTDDIKSHIEGVVMTPQKRPDSDFGLHAVKFLAPAFNDVRAAQFGKTKTVNFCTKQRYHSVISKLDIHERNNTKMVVDMFIQDIIKESPDKKPNDKMKGIWTKLVLQWLADDEYDVDETVLEDKTRANDKNIKQSVKDRRNANKAEEEEKRARRKSQRREETEVDGECETLDMGLFDS